MAKVAFALAVAACGRIGFDPLSGSSGDDTPDGDGGQVDGATGDAMTVDGAPFVCQAVACSANNQFKECNGRCFATCQEPVAWSVADARCQAWGGRAASIREQADSDCLEPILYGTSWLGLTQGSSAGSTSSNWSWADGTPWSFVRWGTTEPNDIDGAENGAEQCGYLEPLGGTWGDQRCTLMLEIACAR